MNRCLLILLFMISSCSGVVINQNSYSSLKSIFFKQEIPLNTDIDYSYIKVELIGNVAILVLAYIDNGIYEWVGADETRIFTFKGKVIRTEGLENDISVNNFNNIFNDDHSFLISFTNPKVYFLNANYNLINSSNDLRTYLLDIHDINLSKKDMYFYLNNKLHKTSQYLNPQLGYIKIEFNL